MRKVLQSFAATAARLSVPTDVTIELLGPCNLRCTHCYVDHAAEIALTFDVVTDTLDQLHDIGCLNVTLTGGEIGLRHDLFDIIAAARTRRFAVYLLSSGTRWGPEEWRRIADLGAAGVRVSMYGTTPDVHDAVTQVPGSLARTIATIDGLLAHDVDVHISAPLMEQGMAQAGALFDFAAARNISITADPNLALTHTGEAAPKKLLASGANLTAFFRDERVTRQLEGRNLSWHADDRPCGVGDIAFIRATGEVYPCAIWPESAGSILTQPFADIWRYSPLFVHTRAITLAGLPTCRSCGDRDGCSPCAAMNQQETGDYRVPTTTACASARAFSASEREEAASAEPLRAVRPPPGVGRLPIIL